MEKRNEKNWGMISIFIVLFLTVVVLLSLFVPFTLKNCVAENLEIEKISYYDSSYVNDVVFPSYGKEFILKEDGVGQFEERLNKVWFRKKYMTNYGVRDPDGVRISYKDGSVTVINYNGYKFTNKEGKEIKYLNYHINKAKYSHLIDYIKANSYFHEH